MEIEEQSNEVLDRTMVSNDNTKAGHQECSPPRAPGSALHDNRYKQTKGQGITPLDKLFIQARKQLGYRPTTPTGLAPNLAAARKRPLENSPTSATTSQIRTEQSDHQRSSEWNEPKRVARQPRLPDKAKIQIENKYARLLDYEDIEQDANQGREHSTQPATAPWPALPPPRPTRNIGTTSSATPLHRAEGRTMNPATPTEHHPSQSQRAPLAERRVEEPRRGKDRPPPIYVCDIQFENIKGVLKKMNSKDLIIKKTDSETCTIFASSLSTYKDTINICKVNQFKFYTYTPNSAKPKNLFLKGIEGNVSAEDIKNDLLSFNLPNTNITKVSKIKFHKNSEKEHFLIQLSNDSDTQSITKIRHLDMQRVYWEPLKRRGLFQCVKCQRFGHSSVNCSLGYRCVKCGKDHEPGKCTIPKSINELNTLYCANCQSAGHPASYKGCPYYKFARKIHVENRASKNLERTKRINLINNYVDKATTPHPANPNTQHNIPARNKIPNRIQNLNKTQNAWFSTKNTNEHLFGNNSRSDVIYNTSNNNNNFNFESFLTRIEQQIDRAINNKLNQIQTAINNNTKRIDTIFEYLNTSLEYVD
ncbi:PREDICTED: nucleic-acid-binding protein from mobile element jockey-like [Polistes dominula]|uniref:Nucleic-acid-binding protein from mobile element jockey-like n=1 Tax=Polistes dominula TaxID=743375 RepID=A0ABM1JBJ5_POLDO|nr:PREDICTED: nucleic-acid-binding protein from mobile element jockey-like [Polistes dominula]